MNRLTCWFLFGVFVASGWVACSPAVVEAGSRELAFRFVIGQLQIVPSPGGADEPIGPKLFITNPDRARNFRKAKELLAKGKNSLDAIAILQERILNQDEDFFFVPDGKNRTLFRSLKSEAQRLIAALPNDARKAYENAYGPTANRMLEDARKNGKISILERVARTYFHTRAGYRATYLLGTFHLDHSEPLAAALHFERLRRIPAVAGRLEPMLSLKTAVCWGRAGMPENSLNTLIELKNATNRNAITIGGREVEFFDHNEDALEWLVSVLGNQQQFALLGEEEWTLFRGNAARNAISPQASPIGDSTWKVSSVLWPNALFDDEREDAEKAAEELANVEAELRKGSFLMMPASHPLIIGDKVVSRAYQVVRAVHLKTGEVMWETSLKDPSYARHFEGNAVPSPQVRRRINGMPQQNPKRALLTQRGWRDLTAGTLSYDGKYVLALEHLGFLGPFRYNPRGPQHPDAPVDSNILMGIEAETGKLSWEVGGKREEHSLNLAGTFFLGPPLPLGGQLYCLSEVGGEIRLLVLEPDPEHETAQLKWSQSLVMPTQSILQYPIRRLAGLSPSYADGVMVCPTTAGAVVGVDLARRLLLWGYRYSTSTSQLPNSPAAFMMAQMRGLYGAGNSDDEDRWLDSVPTIHNGRVLLTPRDSDQLYCLNLFDGEEQWKTARGEGLYVAGVHEDHVIIVGRTLVRALKLSDGSAAWSEPVPIPIPSGRGVRSGRFYHLPLSTGEIATIDLKAGRILARAKMQDGQIPGNLVSAGGTIVSQSHDTVLGFKSFSQLQQQIADGLKNNPDDSQQLALRGEMRLHLGLEEQGLADLERSLELQPDSPHAQSVMVGTLIEGLRLDFAKYRNRAEKVEKSIDDPQQRSRYLRLYATGLQKTGEHQEAFAAFLRLAEPAKGKPQLERMNGALSVRSDIWVRPRIVELYNDASTEKRRDMDMAIRRQFEEALITDENEPLRLFLTAFRNLPIAGEARRKIIERLDPEKHTLELEFHLERLRSSTEATTAAYATARLVSLFLQRERPEHLGALLDELAGKWADVVCFDEKTGRQLANQWRADEKISRILAGISSWPDKKMVANRTVVRTTVQRFYPIPTDGVQSPYFEDWSFKLDQRRQFLIAHDGNGRERWKVELRATGRAVPNVYGNRILSYRHLVVAVLGDHFIVLNTLDASGTPNILWKQGLYEGLGNTQLNRGVQIRQIGLPGGGRKIVIADPFGRPMGSVGPITDHFICYQVGTTLSAAETLTGETLWERTNITRGSKIFGDEKHVFVIAPNANDAMVLRADDGELLGTRPLPAAESRLMTDGRNALTWVTKNGKQKLALTDVLTGRIRWSEEFAEASKATVIKGREVAVLEPNGRFRIFNITDGKNRADSQLEKIENLTQIYVRRSPDRYILLSHHTENNKNNIRAVGLGINTPQVNGFAHGFERATGKRIWTRSIGLQAIDLSQPDNVPILMLSVRTYPLVRKPGALINPNQFMFLVLDKRNGRTVFEYKGNESLFPYELTVDRPNRRIEMKAYRSTITLSTTDQKLESPVRSDLEKPEAKNNPPSKKPKT